MNEPTKQGVTISGGDKAVDRSQTTIDNSSRVSKAVDDHSVRTSSVDDHSVRTTSVTDNSSRVSTAVHDHSVRTKVRDDHSVKMGGTVQVVAALAVVAVLVIWLVPRGGVAPASTVPPSQVSLPQPASDAGRPVRGADGEAPAAPTPPAAAKPGSVSARPSGGPVAAAPVAPPRARAAAESLADVIDVDASGQPQDGLAPGSREAYGDAVETAMLLAKAHFLAWRRGEITHVREIEGIKTLRADTMLIAKGQVRGGRMMSQTSIEEFQTTGVVHIKVRFDVSADVTPRLER